MKVYLSGPITGLTFKQAESWREHAAHRLLTEGGFEIRDPLRGKAASLLPGSRQQLAYKNYPKIPEMTGKAFVMRDHWDVESCDAVLCNLIGAKAVSIGSVFELAWAMDMHKLIVIVMEEKGNTHDHAFVRESGLVFHDLDVAIDYLLYCAGESMEEGSEE